jgi:hypothetical protein
LEDIFGHLPDQQASSASNIRTLNIKTSIKDTIAVLTEQKYGDAQALIKKDGAHKQFNLAALMNAFHQYI